MHLAATPDDADFLTELLPNNVVGVYNVFEAARLAGVRRMILASSGQVVWHRRESPPYPIGDDVAVTPEILVRRAESVSRSGGAGVCRCSRHERRGRAAGMVPAHARTDGGDRHR